MRLPLGAEGAPVLTHSHSLLHRPCVRQKSSIMGARGSVMRNSPFQLGRTSACNSSPSRRAIMPPEVMQECGSRISKHRRCLRSWRWRPPPLAAPPGSMHSSPNPPCSLRRAQRPRRGSPRKRWQSVRLKRWVTQAMHRRGASGESATRKRGGSNVEPDSARAGGRMQLRELVGVPWHGHLPELVGHPGQRNCQGSAA